MKSAMLAIAAAGLLTSGVSFAQTTSGGAPAGTAPVMTPTPMAKGTLAAPAGVNGTTMDRNKNVSAASGNNNQAIASTNANAPTPARGSNSFTMAEAKSRLEKNGFASVANLAKDDNGVWRGSAQKDGSPMPVWLDYKGNSGTGK